MTFSDRKRFLEKQTEASSQKIEEQHKLPEKLIRLKLPIFQNHTEST